MEYIPVKGHFNVVSKFGIYFIYSVSLLILKHYLSNVKFHLDYKDYWR